MLRFDTIEGDGFRSVLSDNFDFEACRGSYESENVPKIILAGNARAGKTSIVNVLFNQMSAHETLLLQQSGKCGTPKICRSRTNPCLKFDVYDLPCNFLANGYVQTFPGEFEAREVLNNVDAVIFVVSLIEDPDNFNRTIELLKDFFTYIKKLNSPSSSTTNQEDGIVKRDNKTRYCVFLHKMDGDAFIDDDTRSEAQTTVQSRVEEILGSRFEDTDIHFHQTSIYDHSVFEAFSKIAQNIQGDKFAVMENLMTEFITNSGVEKSFIFDVSTKLYLCSDSNPIDSRLLELCSTMIDVVLDISEIYGSTEGEAGRNLYYSCKFKSEAWFDEKSSAIISVSGAASSTGGMTLYFREINPGLALICVIGGSSIRRQGVIDYNIEVFRNALTDIIGIESSS